MHLKKVKGILSSSNGMNLYRGCTHGCIYCDSRSKCYHMEHAFDIVGQLSRQIFMPFIMNLVNVCSSHEHTIPFIA